MDIDMTTTFLTESGTATKQGNGKWLVAIATPGQGTSGYYSESVLRETGPVAFPRGAKSFINHDSKRDMRDCVGTFKEGAYWDEDRKQLMGELTPYKHFAELLEEWGTDAGMSIYMAGSADKDGNVLALESNIQNGADIVAYPGLEGSGFVTKLESARAAASEPTVALAEETITGKDTNLMDEKLDKLTTLVEGLVAALTAKAQETAQVEADTALADTRAAAVIASAKAIEAAEGLTATQKEALLESAKDGSDVTTQIEAAVKLRAEILAEAAPVEQPVVAGVVSGRASDGTFVSPWGA